MQEMEESRIKEWIELRRRATGVDGGRLVRKGRGKGGCRGEGGEEGEEVSVVRDSEVVIVKR